MRYIVPPGNRLTYCDDENNNSVLTVKDPANPARVAG